MSVKFNGSKGFSKSNLSSMDAAYEAAQVKDSALIKPRVKFKKGLNVLMWVPGSDTGDGIPYRHALLHYKPFHLCLRPEPKENSSGETFTDRRFGPCPRCKAAWDHFEDEGFKGVDPKTLTVAQQERRDFLKGNLASQQLMIQVLDLTPFFVEVKQGRRTNVIPDEKRIKAHFEDYTRVLSGKDPKGQLPDDIMKAAMSGVSVVTISNANGTGNGSLVTKAFFDRFYENNEVDPLLNPSENLLCITLADSGKTMNGNPVHEWDVKFTNPDIANQGWSPDQEFIETVASLSADLHNIEAEDGTVEARARAFQKLNAEELVMFLEANEVDLVESENSKMSKKEQANKLADALEQDSFGLATQAEDIVVKPSASARDAFNKFKAKMTTDEDEE
jgi:hypothetical protein